MNGSSIQTESQHKLFSIVCSAESGIHQMNNKLMQLVTLLNLAAPKNNIICIVITCL